MKNPEIDKSKILVIEGMSDYVSNGVVIKTIQKRAARILSAVFIDSGEQLTEELSRFDHLIQIIEGNAEVFIDDISYNLNSIYYYSLTF